MRRARTPGDCFGVFVRGWTSWVARRGPKGRRKMRAGGIGGVLTREDVRRRGYASVALNAAIQTLKDEGSADFALLFCEPHNAPFYVGRGWKPFDGEIYAEQPGGRIRFEAIAPYIHDIRRAPRRGTIDLCGLPW